MRNEEKRSFPWISDKAFSEFERSLVFSSVDIIIESNGSFLMGKRKNEPGRGTWGLPGGIIRRRELRKDATLRICRLETTLYIHIVRFLGSYDHMWRNRQYVSCGYLARLKGKNIELPNETAEFSKLQFFETIPLKTHKNYAIMLHDAGLEPEKLT